MCTLLICFTQVADQASMNEAVEEVLDYISRDQVTAQEL